MEPSRSAKHGKNVEWHWYSDARGCHRVTIIGIDVKTLDVRVVDEHGTVYQAPQIYSTKTEAELAFCPAIRRIADDIDSVISKLQAKRDALTVRLAVEHHPYPE